MIFNEIKSTIKTKNSKISMNKLYKYMLFQIYSLIKTKCRKVFI